MTRFGIYLIAMAAAGLAFTLPIDAWAGGNMPGPAAMHHGQTNYSTHADRDDRRHEREEVIYCERGFYGVERCEPSPSGRYYGPYDKDYAFGTGMHILR